MNRRYFVTKILAGLAAIPLVRQLLPSPSSVTVPLDPATQAATTAQQRHYVLYYDKGTELLKWQTPHQQVIQSDLEIRWRGEPVYWSLDENGVVTFASDNSLNKMFRDLTPL